MTESQRQRMEYLISEITFHNNLYYSLGEPIISDKEWDKLYDELVALEKQTGVTLDNSPTKNVGAEIKKGFAKVEHKKPLYSLDKAQSISAIEDWMQRNEKLLNHKFSCSVEYKFDGLTTVVSYNHGFFESATTRGNGKVGEDVTKQAMTIESIPKTIPFIGELQVHGETMMRLSKLKEYNKKATEPLKNARNGAAGALRNLDPQVTKQRQLDFMAYNVHVAEGQTFSTQTEMNNFLKAQGFLVSDYYVRANTMTDIKNEIERVGKTKKNLDFLIDGLVLKIDNIHDQEELGFTDKFPRGQLAYKFEAEETTTPLNDVVWQVGRTGKLTPIAELEPIEIAGVTVKRATLNNAGDISRKKLKIHSRVVVRRSNEVIPEVMGVAMDCDQSTDIIIPSICPACGSKLQTIGANLFCPNRDGCIPQIVARLTHFASKEGMNIEGLSDKTIKLLFHEKGVCEFHHLYDLNSNDLKCLDSFKDKKTTNLLQNIEKSKSAQLSNFVFALGIDGIGKKMARDLAKKFKTIDGLIAATRDEILQMDDVADITADNIFEYFQNEQNVKEIQFLHQKGVNIASYVQVSSNKLENEKVVLTGSLVNYTRSQAAKLLEDLGAEVQSSVTKTTTMVVFGSDAGSKLEKAKKLGIRLVDEAEFVSLTKK